MQIKKWFLVMVAMSSVLTPLHPIIITQVVHAPDENESMVITIHSKKAWGAVLVSSPEWVIIVERYAFPRCLIPYEFNPALEWFELHGMTREGKEFDVVDPVSKKVVWHVILGDHCSSDDIVNSCGYGRKFDQVVIYEPQLDLCNHKAECQTLCSCGAGSLELDLIETCDWAAAQWRKLQYEIENPR